MPFKRWDPFQEVISLHQELFGKISGLSLEGGGQHSWTPLIDVFEVPEAYVIRAEIPGMEPESIKIEYRDRKLRIFGERLGHSDYAARRYFQLERSHGPFERSFILPESVNCDEIEANYEAGLLEIVIPKKEETKPKRIPVDG